MPWRRGERGSGGCHCYSCEAPEGGWVPWRGWLRCWAATSSGIRGSLPPTLAQSMLLLNTAAEPKEGVSDGGLDDEEIAATVGKHSTRVTLPTIIIDWRVSVSTNSQISSYLYLPWMWTRVGIPTLDPKC